MTQAAPIPPLCGPPNAALGGRVASLQRDLDEEMAARARAEREAGDLRELARDLQRSAEGLEAESRMLWRLLGTRLLKGSAPFAVAGLVGGFAAVLLVHWAGF
jgi:hypothetical protein